MVGTMKAARMLQGMTRGVASPVAKLCARIARYLARTSSPKRSMGTAVMLRSRVAMILSPPFSPSLGSIVARREQEQRERLYAVALEYLLARLYHGQEIHAGEKEWVDRQLDK